MTRPYICSEDRSGRGADTPLLEPRLPAREVAKVLGVKVGTLSRWRQLGKGPRGWIHLSQTLVVYPIAAVEDFLKESEAHVPNNSKGGDNE